MSAVPERADEPCSHCLQRYELHMEIRCVECDGPMCPICVVHVRERRVTVCPECRPDEDG